MYNININLYTLAIITIVHSATLCQYHIIMFDSIEAQGCAVARTLLGILASLAHEHTSLRRR